MSGCTYGLARAFPPWGGGCLPGRGRLFPAAAGEAGQARGSRWSRAECSFSWWWAAAVEAGAAPGQGQHLVEQGGSRSSREGPLVSCWWSRPGQEPAGVGTEQQQARPICEPGRVHQAWLRPGRATVSCWWSRAAVGQGKSQGGAQGLVMGIAWCSMACCRPAGGAGGSCRPAGGAGACHWLLRLYRKRTAAIHTGRPVPKRAELYRKPISLLPVSNHPAL